jgi:hypothetical protein
LQLEDNKLHSWGGVLGAVNELKELRNLNLNANQMGDDVGPALNLNSAIKSLSLMGNKISMLEGQILINSRQMRYSRVLYSWYFEPTCFCNMISGRFFEVRNCSQIQFFMHLLNR